MKHKYLLLLPFLFLFSIGKGTHHQGGFISYQFISGNTFQFTVTTFTKVSYPSILADRDSLTLDCGDASWETLIRLNGPDANSNGYPDGQLCGSDILKSIYSGTHTYVDLPPLAHPYFIISLEDQNRIDGIANMANGSSVNIPFFLSDTVYVNAVSVSGVNSSPLLQTCATPYAQVGQNFVYSPAFYDADGDSMAFTLATPLQALNAEVPLYDLPDQYCISHGSATNSFNINNTTGEVTWNAPCQTGIYSAAIQVREFRCGVMLSSSIFDFQIIVLNENNQTPVFTASTSDVFLAPGDTLNVQFSAVDADTSQLITLLSNGEPFTFSTNPATFSTAAGNPANGNIFWVPDATQRQQNGYIFSVEARDNYTVPGPNGPMPAPLSDFTTFRVWVTDTTICDFTSINNLEPSMAVVEIWPNPSNDVITIQGAQPLDEVSIYDSQGRLVNQQLKSTTTTNVQVNQLASGLYFIRTKIQGQYQTLKFIKE